MEPEPEKMERILSYTEIKTKRKLLPCPICGGKPKLRRLMPPLQSNSKKFLEELEKAPMFYHCRTKDCWFAEYTQNVVIYPAPDIKGARYLWNRLVYYESMRRRGMNTN